MFGQDGKGEMCPLEGSADLTATAGDVLCALDASLCAPAVLSTQSGELKTHCAAGGNGVWSRPAAVTVGYAFINCGECDAQADISGPGVGPVMERIPAGGVVSGSLPGANLATISCLGCEEDDCDVIYAFAW